MPSIFSTQNLQTFLRRKNLRPPSRGPAPGPAPGRPPGRGPRGPPSRGPPSGRAAGASMVATPVSGAAVFVDSSAMILLQGHPGPYLQLLSAFQAGNGLLMNLSDVQQASGAFGNLTHIFAQLTDVLSEQFHRLRQDSVAFHQPVQAFVDGHISLSAKG